MIPQTAAQAQIQAILDGFAKRSLKEIVLGLERTTEALGRLGNPHEKLPPVIHIAGTNGKGSTLAYMRAMLTAGGLRVHAFTSPHLVRFNERIVLAGEEIDDELLATLLARCESAAGDLPLSYFEAVTVAAFMAYAEKPGDVLLLETGLGGRLDSTNVIAQPRASVITPIDYDHQRFLGETIEEIAGEKAGIIKRDAAIVTGRQRGPALEVLRSRALAVGARPAILNEDWTAREENGRLVYEDETGLSDLSLPRLPGRHQIENAGLAVATLKAAGLAPDDAALSAGLESATWPARMQRLDKGPLVALAQRYEGEHAELWLDGGHNPHAARALAGTLADFDERLPRPVILIVGMQEGKDAQGFFEGFEGIASTVFTLKASGGSPRAPDELAQVARAAGLPAEPAPDLESAINSAITATAKSGEGMPRILICGSLYLAADILKENS